MDNQTSHRPPDLVVTCVAPGYPHPEYLHDSTGYAIERLNLALLRNGVATKVVTQFPRGRSLRFRREGISVSAILTRGRGTSVITSGSMAGRIHTIDQAETADAIHAHGVTPCGIAAWLSTFRVKRPYVLTLTKDDLELHLSSWSTRVLARRVVRSAAAVVSTSSAVAEYMARFASRPTRSIIVQPNPVDFEGNAEGRGGSGLLIVGDYRRPRELEEVLRGIATLGDHIVGCNKAIVGRGDPSVVAMRAKALGLDKTVRLVSNPSQSEAVDLIGDAALVVFAAVRDDLPIEPARALVMGVPVVAGEEWHGDVGVVPPTGAGRVVRVHDGAAFANAIAELFGSDVGKRLAVQTGETLRRRLGSETVGSVYRDIFLDVAGG